MNIDKAPRSLIRLDGNMIYISVLINKVVMNESVNILLNTKKAPSAN